MNFAAFGRTRWLYESIRACVARGHRLVLLGTCAAAPEYDIVEADFERLAGEQGCPFFCDARINQSRYVDLARASGADVAISINWLTLIGETLRGVFPHGVLNAHAGDLPRYRGNACPNWAILNSESEVVLTIHAMADELDAGPVCLKRRMHLTDTTYIGDVYRFMDAAVPGMFADVLEGLERGDLAPRPQPEDPALSLRCFPRLPEDGLIDWSQPAERIARLVRASAEPFAGAFTFLGEQRLTIWRARAERLAYPWVGVPGQVAERDVTAGTATILTGNGVLLAEEVQLGDGARTPAAEVLSSLRMRFRSGRV